jgi:hypothetical protein
LISAWVENHDVALDRWQGPFVVHFAQARTIAAWGRDRLFCHAGR